MSYTVGRKMDGSDQEHAGVFERSYDAFVERLPYLKLGGSHTETVRWTSDLPVFSVNREGRGLSNFVTEARVDQHIKDTSAVAAMLYRAALRAIAQANANLDSHSIPRTPYVVDLKQHMTVCRRGQLQTEIQMKVTRTDR